MDEDCYIVVNRELTLLEPAVRASPDAVRELLHEDFREFGASGSSWDRRRIVEATSGDASEHTVATDLRTRRLGPDAILLTYTARRHRSSSLRSSIWVRGDGTWLLLHHQGTAMV